MEKTTKMIHTGFNPPDAYGSAKAPIVLTSTFPSTAPSTAEKQERRFKILAGWIKPKKGEEEFIYSRFSNPNTRIVESKMTVLEEGAKAALAFPSGMSAITTTILALSKPGQVILYTQPIYGCTEDFFRTICKKFDINAISVDTSKLKKVEQVIQKYKDRAAMLFIETPANPNLRLSDIKALSDLARKYETKKKKIYLVVDNTFLGPVYQKPFLYGADIVVYSATKFIGGHSDLLAGFTLIREKHDYSQIKHYRDDLGPTISPFDCWQITRSLETLDIRMKEQTESAMLIAKFLASHPKVKKVYYPGLLKEGDPQYGTYIKQCLAPGSMISFELKNGTKKMAFRVINSFKIFVNAVSLGARESLVCNPFSTTHLAVPISVLKASEVTPSLIRLSIGGEDPNDLINDLKQALKYA